MIETTVGLRKEFHLSCDVKIYWTCCQVGLVRLGERSPFFYNTNLLE